MTKSLASYPDAQRQAVARRRLNGLTHGSGFWAAKDYFNKKGLDLPRKLGSEESTKEAMEAIEYDDKGFAKNFSNAPRNRRHQNDDGVSGDGGSQPSRRKHKPRNNRQVHSTENRLDMSAVRRNVSAMGGGKGSPRKSPGHTNKPRLAGVDR